MPQIGECQSSLLNVRPPVGREFSNLLNLSSSSKSCMDSVRLRTNAVLQHYFTLGRGWILSQHFSKVLDEWRKWHIGPFAWCLSRKPISLIFIISDGRVVSTCIVSFTCISGRSTMAVGQADCYLNCYTYQSLQGTIKMGIRRWKFHRKPFLSWKWQKTVIGYSKI